MKEMIEALTNKSFQLGIAHKKIEDLMNIIQEERSKIPKENEEYASLGALIDELNQIRNYLRPISL
jgi:translation initiation factor 2B subunit (eIF-2B alpha/beta/delta family)